MYIPMQLFSIYLTYDAFFFRLVVVLNGPKSIREAFITKGHDFSGRPNSLAMQLVGMPDSMYSYVCVLSFPAILGRNYD